MKILQTDLNWWFVEDVIRLSVDSITMIDLCRSKVVYIIYGKPFDKVNKTIMKT